MFKRVKYVLGFLMSITLFSHAVAAPLVVYSGRSEALIGPILQQFQKDTGVQLDIRYNNTPALATQLLTEGKDTPADVMLFQESGYLEVLSKAGLLQPLDKELLAQVDSKLRDTNGYWIGTSARARVLVYNPTLIKETDLPRRLGALADPQWKGKLGWAPENASFQANISALRHLWDEKNTEDWLIKMKNQNPVVYPNNAAQVKAVAAGEIAVGWVNHYYVHQLKQQDPKLNAKNYHFPTKEDAGNILMIAGGAIHKQSKQAEQAKQLLNYLVGKTGQTYFAQKTFEYPTRPGIPVHPDVTPLDQISFAKVEQAWLADVKPTVVLLKKLGIMS